MFRQPSNPNTCYSVKYRIKIKSFPNEPAFLTALEYICQSVVPVSQADSMSWSRVFYSIANHRLAPKKVRSSFYVNDPSYSWSDFRSFVFPEVSCSEGAYHRSLMRSDGCSYYDGMTISWEILWSAFPTTRGPDDPSIIPRVYLLRIGYNLTEYWENQLDLSSLPNRMYALELKYPRGQRDHQ